MDTLHAADCRETFALPLATLCTCITVLVQFFLVGRTMASCWARRFTGLAAVSGGAAAIAHLTNVELSGRWALSEGAREEQESREGATVGRGGGGGGGSAAAASAAGGGTDAGERKGLYGKQAVGELGT
jgi:hypothetical protein